MAHRFRHALALALSVATVLATAACSIGAPVTRAARTDEITVWVMQDDFSAATIDAINTRFRAQTGAEVHVQTQPWDGIATKLMTALATSNPPDVIDIGNTKVLEFARTGALLDLSAQREELAHGGTWLDGLEQPMTYDGGLYAAPAFGAARTVIYNRRMWREAGITTPPTTYDELCGDLDRVQRAHAGDADFSALYLPGQNWFTGLQFLWDAGASPAELRDGQWTATLGSPNGIAGLQAWASFQNRYSSKASRTADTLIPDQAQLLGQQKTSAIIWNASAVTKAVASNPQLSADDFGAFPMPSVSGDGQQPTMMSGSGWAVATRSAAPSLALAWISIATSPAVERAWIVEHDGWLPNTRELTAEYLASGKLSAVQRGFFEAAMHSRSTPNAPGWATIEADGSLKELFSKAALDPSKAQDIADAFDERTDAVLSEAQEEL